MRELYLGGNQLTSVPAEIGQLASLTSLNLESNQLTSLPAEIGQLTSEEWLCLDENELTSMPAEIGQLTSLEGVVPPPQSADERASCDTRAQSGGLPSVSGRRRDGG